MNSTTLLLSTYRKQSFNACALAKTQGARCSPSMYSLKGVEATHFFAICFSHHRSSHTGERRPGSSRLDQRNRAQVFAVVPQIIEGVEHGRAESDHTISGRIYTRCRVVFQLEDEPVIIERSLKGDQLGGTEGRG
jgi:hypothetical protein